MPIYVYRCDECGEIFEKLVSVSKANDAPPCPACASPETHKQLATVNTAASGSAASACGGGGRFT